MNDSCQIGGHSDVQKLARKESKLTNHDQMAQSLYERFNNRDVDGVIELLHADVEWVNEPKGLHVRGLDELRALWKRQKGAAIVHFDITRVTPREHGFFVVVQEKVWKHDKELLFDGPVGHDYKLKDKKIVRCDIVDADLY